MQSAASDECRAFLAAQAVETTPSPDTLVALDGALDRALATALDAGLAAWPDLRQDRIGFATFLGQRIPSDVDAIAALSERALDELYLAFACLAGDPPAIRLLDERYLTALVPILVQQRMPPDLARETVQELRVQLLTGERPVLRAYSGIGSLKGWLRITTLRDAIRARRKARALEGDEVTEALADRAADPALQYQRHLYRAEFRTAFAHAVASLSVRERNLLRQSVIYGATVDDLGALYHVHRATAARWISAARDRLAEITRQKLIVLLGITPDEYDSILTLIQSQLDVSVERVLGGGGRSDGGPVR